MHVIFFSKKFMKHNRSFTSKTRDLSTTDRYTHGHQTRKHNISPTHIVHFFLYTLPHDNGDHHHVGGHQEGNAQHEFTNPTLFLPYSHACCDPFMLCENFHYSHKFPSPIFSNHLFLIIGTCNHSP